MSYNISKWTTKKIENLIIPLECFKNIVGLDIDKIKKKDNQIDFEFANSMVCGVVNGDYLIVNEIEISHEISGSIFENWLKPTLKKSKGTLIATIVWEDGDSYLQIECTDGIIIEKQLEL